MAKICSKIVERIQRIRISLGLKNAFSPRFLIFFDDRITMWLRRWRIHTERLSELKNFAIKKCAATAASILRFVFIHIELVRIVIGENRRATSL